MSQHGFTARELAHEAARELASRINNYPWLIQKDMLTKDQADRQIALMEVIAERLAREADNEDAQERLL